MPTTGQLVLLAITILLLAIGGLVSAARLWADRQSLRMAAKVCMAAGLSAALAVVLWHASARNLCPLNDNFAALVFLALLLGAFVMYVQHARPLPGLDWFIMPIVVLLLIVAGIFGTVDYHQYAPLVQDAWLWVHRLTTYGGAIVLAVAAAAGAMYLIASRRLRAKTPQPLFASLERLENLVMHSVTLGFALLTIGLITGFIRLLERNQLLPLAKLVPGTLAWLLYAVVLHVPLNPRLRGRRAAILSMLGFVLLVATIVVVQLIPGGKR